MSDKTTDTKLEQDIETQKISEEDASKAKTSGKIHGDPIIEF
jgi:PIN domain nuclease of toxin-antitoxin system